MDHMLTGSVHASLTHGVRGKNGNGKKTTERQPENWATEERATGKLGKEKMRHRKRQHLCNRGKTASENLGKGKNGQPYI